MIMVKELNNKKSDGFETVRYQSIVLYLTTFLAFHFVNPLINFKTGLLTTPHFVALATSQLFTMENTLTTKLDESQLFLIKSCLNYLILPASLILYVWFSKYK